PRRARPGSRSRLPPQPTEAESRLDDTRPAIIRRPMSAFLTADGLVALLTLTALEIVLGVDNLVFISIISGRLPAAQQPLARKVGLGLALITRLLLLFTISWMMGLTRPLFRSPLGGEISGRDLILLLGGLFLIAKAT